MNSAVPADPMLPQPFRIRKARRELNDTFTLDLVPADGVGVIDFAPGQFNMLYVFGVGEVAISISGDPGDGAALIHTVRAVGSVTQPMARMKRGEMLGVRGPFGTGWPVAEAEGNDVVIVAGGLGLAPLRPAIYRVLANRPRYGSVCIFYGARTPDDILYRHELQGWRGQFDLTVDVTVDRALGDWAGKVGVVTKLLSQGGFDPLNTVAMVCGPEVMMRYAVKTLNEQRVGYDRIFVSMERNMKCAVGFCGHCQFGPSFVCREGPVYRFDKIKDLFELREI